MVRIHTRSHTQWSEIWHAIFIEHRQRSVLGLTLMIAQAFFYNAIFFTYALVLGTYYNIPGERGGLYLFPFAAGNFVGPLVLGHLFDSIGRRQMIAATYGTSGILLAITAVLFQHGEQPPCHSCAGALRNSCPEIVLVAEMRSVAGTHSPSRPQTRKKVSEGAARRRFAAGTEVLPSSPEEFDGGR